MCSVSCPDGQSVTASNVTDHIKLHELEDRESQKEAIVDGRCYPVFRFDGRIFDGKDGNLYAVVYNRREIYRLNGNKLGSVVYKSPQSLDLYVTNTGYDHVIYQLTPRYRQTYRVWRIFQPSNQKEYRYTQSSRYSAPYGFNVGRQALVIHNDGFHNCREMRCADLSSRPITEWRTAIDVKSSPNVDRLLVAKYDTPSLIHIHNIMGGERVSTVDLDGLPIHKILFYYPLAPNIVILLGMSDDYALFIVKDQSIVFQLPIQSPIFTYSAESMGNRCLISLYHWPDRRRYIYANLDNERFCVLSGATDASLLCSGVVARLKQRDLLIIPTADLEQKQFGLITFAQSQQSVLALL